MSDKQFSLKKVDPSNLPPLQREPLDSKALLAAAEIVESVKTGGVEALLKYGIKFGDLKEGEPYLLDREKLKEAFESLAKVKQDILVRTAKRIIAFAKAQKDSLTSLTTEIPGGLAGHTIKPVEKAGCYAPGGRFPLPSSVLMTALTARVAGVKKVIVASPKPTVETLAACHVAGADSCLCIGGAQSIAAMAYGAGSVEPVDIIVGPGNSYVTAAKQLVNGKVAIDMLAGPSELVVFADKNAKAELIAADLLAQAEHDPQAVPILVTDNDELIDLVNEQLEWQLKDLSTFDTASIALKNGMAIHVKDINQGVQVCDQLAPEHLELMLENASQISEKLNNYGALFIGEQSAEVLGDYGAGPNHVLPTGGTSRYCAGLSVFTFLRIRTWMRVDDAQKAVHLHDDSEKLALIEGLEGHSKAAKMRKV